LAGVSAIHTSKGVIWTELKTEHFSRDSSFIRYFKVMLAQGFGSVGYYLWANFLLKPSIAGLLLLEFSKLKVNLDAVLVNHSRIFLIVVCKKFIYGWFPVINS